MLPWDTLSDGSNQCLLRKMQLRILLPGLEIQEEFPEFILEIWKITMSSFHLVFL